MAAEGERRAKGSGAVETKRCPICQAEVVIDPRLISRNQEGHFQVCPSCGEEVPMRHTDVLRRPPPGPPAAVPEKRGRRRFGRRKRG